MSTIVCQKDKKNNAIERRAKGHELEKMMEASFVRTSLSLPESKMYAVLETIRMNDTYVHHYTRFYVIKLPGENPAQETHCSRKVLP